MSKTFSENRLKHIKSFAKAFYCSNIEHYEPNPNFELCMRIADGEKWKCNTCQHKAGCSEGETMLVTENPVEIAERLAEAVYRILETVDSKKDKKEASNG